jgi:hypothetical protein
MTLESILEFSLIALTAYCGVGGIVALFLVVRSYNSVDASAKHGTWGFRLAVWPATIFFWPWLLWRFRAGYELPQIEENDRPARLRRRPLRAFKGLAVAIPLLAAAALFWREPTLRSLPAIPWSEANPQPWTEEFTLKETRVPSLPISIKMGRSRHEQRTVELTIQEALTSKALALYWSRFSQDTGLPVENYFLGVVQGPSTLRFALPQQKQTESASLGCLYFVSLANDQELFLPFPLEVK